MKDRFNTKINAKAGFRFPLPGNAVAPLAMLGLLVLALAPSSARADRGGGSIRAAGRAGPEPSREPVRAAPEPRRVEPARVEPARAPVEVRHDIPVAPPRRIEVPVARDWDDHDVDIRHGGGFAHGAPVRIIRGQRFHDLPHHREFRFNNIDYFYDDDGNYYLPENGDYVVVQPPVGALVPGLPPGVETVSYGATLYYYLDGVFYVPQADSFAVVNPPPGIVVPDLPIGAVQVVVGGNVYYQFSGFNYQPSIQDGVTAYTVTPM